MLRTDAPAFRRAIADVRERLFTLAGNPLSTAVSRDRHSAIVVMTIERWVPPSEIRASLATVHAPGVAIAETGDVSADEAQHAVVHDDLNRAEMLSIPVTLLVLLFAFGSLVAALVPVLLALTAVAAAF